MILNLLAMDFLVPRIKDSFFRLFFFTPCDCLLTKATFFPNKILVDVVALCVLILGVSTQLTFRVI